jgi:16S rRNA (guanine(527)-N(7))-methyltransferase RsmG
MLSEVLGRWFELEPAQWKALEAHYELLCRWNKVLNLTRIEHPEEAAERHYGESLFLAHQLPAGNWRIADVGSGPGFPGFPVAVARPGCCVTLIESHQRKAVFLREATRGLPNAVVLAKRANEVEPRFDWVVSRAVSYADLATCLPNLASHVALLTGIEEPPSSLGFSWEPPIPLPWGKQRFLRVSRGTVGD